MKLVIQTQYRENYGAHDWSGEGECPQYWKFKGGSTYVVRDISPAQRERINSSGIPTLTTLIEYRNEASEEYILGYEVVEDDAPEGEPWETATEFQWKLDRWIAVKHTDNRGEYGYMRSEILSKRESWIQLIGGERSDYRCEYELAHGWFNSEQATLELQHAAA